MSLAEQILDILEIATKRVPPGEHEGHPQRHNLTMNENGELEIAFMLSDRRYTVTFDEDDRLEDINGIIDRLLTETST